MEDTKVFQELCKDAYNTASDKGFWSSNLLDIRDDQEFCDPWGSTAVVEEFTVVHKTILLSLVMTEVAEAIEALRSGAKDDKLTDTDGYVAEIADVFIRLFDFCGGYGIDILPVIKAKMEYNKGRSKRHGKKF